MFELIFSLTINKQLNIGLIPRSLHTTQSNYFSSEDYDFDSK